jgi:predicted ATPase/signal transduction histidine kinase
MDEAAPRPVVLASAPASMEYAISETLHRGGSTTLYRALRPGDRSSVVLKVVDPLRCRPGDLARLRHEHEIGASLEGPKVLRPLGLDTHQGMPALVLEGWSGQPLDHLLGERLPVQGFLELAIRMADAVAQLHRQGVIHKDLKPENILVDPRTMEVKLADFGIATRLPREQQPARPPALIEGSMPYMSPEQTGRMNRALDSRSDLYSLGVTFYQMLTGRLPFEAGDPLEWVHCHVAREPAPPARLVPEIPETVSRILMKLLAKMAEDRYQTARGLEHDLARCLEAWRRERRIEPFTLGERDAPDRLQIPQKLYGREDQVAALLRVFERVADTGSPELVLVSGYSGIGKSSLVHELEKPIVGRRGLFAEGKFDQYKRDVPYSTIVQAFRELVLDLLVEGEERVSAWRQRLQGAVGMNGRLIVDMIPQVELVIGSQPQVPELGLSEAKDRFHVVFRRFLGAFAHEEHPLTLFLDDLQWADPASLELLADVLSSPETRHLLVVGAYRDNEVTPAHPLMMALAGIRRTALAVRDLVLDPLSREDLGQLVADAMRRSQEDIEPLTRLVREKTAGNPFFALQFLTSLHGEGLIRFDPKGLAWRCDIDRARSRGYTDNVVDLMVAKLRRLPVSAQEAVSLAACVGNAADAGTLALLRERSQEETHHDLWVLVQEGLLHRSDDTYRFSHDRVQQAAHALIPEGQRRTTHLRIGRLLRAHTPRRELREKVFDIVNQLNRGASLIEDLEERYGLAELDLLAAQRARASTAYGAAAQYLAAGMAVLPETAWEDRYELAFALHLERARCEFLIGSFDLAERQVGLALRNARTRAEKAACYLLRIEVYAINGEVEKAIDSVFECAALFGLHFELHPPPESVQERYDGIMRCLGDRSIEQLIDLPPMSDRDILTLVEALVAVITIAYQHDLCLPFAFTSEVVRFSIERGNAPCSAHAYGLVGMLVGPYLGQYRQAYRFGKLGHDLIERRGLMQYKAGNAVCFGYYTLFWTRHVKEALAHLEAGLRAGVETGNLRDACYCAMNTVSVLLARGEPLDEVERRSAQMLALARTAKFAYVEDMILSQRRLLHRLRGRTPSQAPAIGPPEDEALDTRILQRVPLAVCVYYIRELQERFLFGDYREALFAGAQAKDLLWTSMASWERCEHSYFFALSLAATCAETSSRDREECLHALRAEAELHRGWAENGPENFQNRHALVSAELARAEGRELDAERLYEQAIRSARENGFVQNEALAYELASKFYRARGYEQFADVYLRDARACYVRWGAEGKVKQLERFHPQLAEPRSLAPIATLALRSEQLDLLSVVKASQTISGKLELEKLTGTLLEVALQQGGARQGFLVLARGDVLSIEAGASLEQAGVATTTLPSLAAESSQLVPASVLQYVWRTREPVIVDDATARAGKFASDPYFARRRTRSVLCLPILRQELIGLLYLENDLVAGAFTPDRLIALSLLASQAAISVENARLLLEERKARQRSAFLADAGALLSESLDFEATLGRLSRLCVQSLADWCVLDLVEGGEIRRLAGACRDRAKEPLLEQLRQRTPARRDSPHPAARVLRSGEPLLLPEITDEAVKSHSEDEEHLKLILELRTRSGLAVPLLARGQTLGVLTLGSGTPGRYGRADLELAQEVAHRAAMAIDNARLYGQAQEGIRVREEFLSVASHELRTPTAGLMLSLESLVAARRRAQRADPHTTNKLLDLLVRQGKRLVRLSGDLLDASRIEAGRLSLRLEEVDLVALVGDVVEQFKLDLERSGSRLSMRSVEVRGRWDRGRLEQVVTNLLSNAVKFGEGKPIEVSLGQEGGLARLVVKDAGIGISPQLQARIFDRFQRAVSSEHYGGLGLGLYISRRIVEAHGGSIRVESRPDAGSTFTVELPVEPHCPGARLATGRAG